ncbi:uncharacterized protein N7458_002533 [Penicillium daleae]|uniref:Uncharacterized protein n=1 Tax=Penicillium daleae TaxID=63821 RepID=A0AAD6CCX2_9EURO|nr:uncharacterized protein N7458_002533 [Penicillium daleae]KAJ5460981.1 hypothetical protein N7458_002533 [Penicillium daleae]
MSSSGIIGTDQDIGASDEKTASSERIAGGATTSLTGELRLMVHKNASLARTAIELLDLYLCLWECYVTRSAAMIRLEEERRLLQSSNDWLARENGRLHEACTNQALLLWDRRQTLDSIQQGVFEILQSSDRFSNQMSELSRRTHEDGLD